MSYECSECEMDLRGGHAEGCSRECEQCTAYRKELAEAKADLSTFTEKYKEHYKRAEQAEAANAALSLQVEEAREALKEGRQLAYEIGGGNRWPVEWDDDTHIEPPLLAFKNALAEIGLALPAWERNGPGFKRKALSSLPAKPDEKKP